MVGSPLVGPSSNTERLQGAYMIEMWLFWAYHDLLN